MSFNKLLHTLNCLSAYLLVIWVCLPWFGQNTGLILGFLLAATWTSTAFLIHPPKKLSVDAAFMILFLVCVSCSLILRGRVYGEYAFYYATSMMALFFLPYYMMRFYVKGEQTKFLGKLAACAIFCMAIGAFMSSYYTYIDPNIMKTISQAKDTELVEYRKLGIGSFGFVYMLVFCVISLFGALRNKALGNKRSTLLVIAFLIVGIKCIVDSTFTTALLLTVIGVLLVLISDKNNRKYNHIAYISLFILFVFISQLLGNFLANVTLKSSDVTIRLNEIGNLLLGEETGENVGSRWDYMQKSLNCFWEYPLFGYNMQAKPQITMGGHSEWVDLFAVYGLVGGLPLLATVIYKLNETKKAVQKKMNYPFFGVLLMIFTFYGFVDPFLRLYHIGFVMFLIIPGIACLPQAYEKKERVI